MHKIDADLVESSKQLAKVTAELTDQAEVAVEELKALEERYETEEDPDELAILESSIADKTKTLDRLSGSMKKFDDMTTKFQNRVTEDIANGDLKDTEKSMSDYLALSAIVVTALGAGTDLIGCGSGS